MTASLGDRLRLKPEMRVLLWRAPGGFSALLAPLPDGLVLETAPDGQYDAVIVCVASIAEAEQHSVAAAQAVKPNGIFWTCYPKKAGAIRTDITRDQGWSALMAAGWGPVAQISVDDTWSALRWRPESGVKRKDDSRFGTSRYE